MNCPGHNKKLKKIFNFWMEPRMGPPYQESQMWINSQGYPAANSKQKISVLWQLLTFPHLRAGCLDTTLITTMYSAESYPKHMNPCIHSKTASQIME